MDHHKKLNTTGKQLESNTYTRPAKMTGPEALTPLAAGDGGEEMGKPSGDQTAFRQKQSVYRHEATKREERC